MSLISTIKNGVFGVKRDLNADTGNTLQGYKEKVESPLYGVVAEFDDTDALLHAARAVREAGYNRVEAYTPMPVEGLNEILAFKDKFVPQLMLCGGMVGGITGYAMQWFAQVNSYPLNVGGKPLHSWPQQLVITFEMTILFTALSGVFGMIMLNGLPQPYHSIFNAPNFERASTDRFFLAIESRDRNFNPQAAMQLLSAQPNVLRVSEVER